MVISDWSSDVCSSDLYGIDGETTDFEISGNYVRTDRTETERSFEYDDPTAISGSVGNGGNLLTDNSNINDIDPENYSIAGKLTHAWSLGPTTPNTRYARFKATQAETALEIDFEEDAPALDGTLTRRDIPAEAISFGRVPEFPGSAEL